MSSPAPAPAPAPLAPTAARVSAAPVRPARWRRTLVGSGSAGLVEGSVDHDGAADGRARLEIVGGPCGAVVELAVDGHPLGRLLLDPLGSATVDLDVAPAVLARASIVVSQGGDVLLHASTTAEARR